MGSGTGQISRAFVDLVKRIGGQHQTINVGTVERHLGKREQCLPGAVYRQYLGFRAQAVAAQLEAVAGPVSDGPAQFRQPFGGWIHRQFVDIVDNALFHESRAGVLGFTNGQRDVLQVAPVLGTLKQLGQFFKRVGLQLVQITIHVQGAVWSSFSLIECLMRSQSSGSLIMSPLRSVM